MLKPYAPIYHRLLERYGQQGWDSLFIDDNKDNVTAAIEVGMHSVRFTDAENLVQQLREFGIEI
jgi:HAD superfamily hydrolase (TIGR01509 family)